MMVYLQICGFNQVVHYQQDNIMAKKVSKAEYQKALGVVKAYAKQETKVAANKTKKYAKSTYGKFKSLFKK